MDNIKRLIAECKKLEFNNKVTFKVPLNDVQDEIDMLNHKQSIIPVVIWQSGQFFCGVKGGYCPMEIKKDGKCTAEFKCENQVTK